MVKSAIFSAIELRYLPNWKDELTQNDDFDFFATAQKEKAKLNDFLNEEGKDTFWRYTIALENYYDQMYHTLLSRIIHLGVKMGMDLQESLDTEFDGLLTF